MSEPVKKKINYKRFRISRMIGGCCLYLSKLLISPLPENVYKIVKYCFLPAGHIVILVKQQIILKNLRAVFGREKSEEEIKDIARRYRKNFAEGMIDLIYFTGRMDQVKAYVKMDGKEHLDKVLQAGKGAIIVSAHFGNFILMYMSCIAYGYKTNVIMKRTRDEFFEQYISRFRESHDLKTIYDLPARACVSQSIKALRNNEILFIILDQNYGSEGRIFVDFLGRSSATATGPYVFSKRTGAPIVPMFIMHDDEKNSLNSRIVIEPPYTLVEKKDAREELYENISNLTGILEKYIRLKPHEWGGWMHKRWKTCTHAEQTLIDMLNEDFSSLYAL